MSKTVVFWQCQQTHGIDDTKRCIDPTNKAAEELEIALVPNSAVELGHHSVIEGVVVIFGPNNVYVGDLGPVIVKATPLSLSFKGDGPTMCCVPPVHQALK